MSILTSLMEGSLQARPHGSYHVLIYILLLASIVIFVLGYRRSPRLPVINGYAWDWSQKRAKQEFYDNTVGLLNEGVRKYPDQPFWLIAARDAKIILPYSYIDWVKRHPDLHHLTAVGLDFFDHYPGFEGITAFAGDPDTFLLKLVKQKWTQISPTVVANFDKSSETLLQKHFGDSKDYHTVPWHEICMEIVALTTCQVFVGARLAHDQEWQAIVASYPQNMFNAARILRSWPAILHPLIHWWLPECRLCREQVAAARKKIEQLSLQDKEFDDTALQWSLASENLDPAVLQMGLVFGAVHTTSQTLQQCVTDIALAANSNQHPSLISDLRLEIDTVLAKTDGNFAPSTLPKLVLLDACIKESQRLNPQSLTSLERVTKRAVTLPSGVVVPKGTQIAVDTAPMQSESLWGPDATSWNPYRFLKEENTRMKANSVNSKHYAFGLGPSACPGRFLAIAEVKVIMAKLIRGWDLKLVIPKDLDDWGRKALDQGRVPFVIYGNELVSDERFGIEARKTSA